MFAIVKTQFGWTVKHEATGRILANESSLLSALAIKAHFESGEPLPAEVLADLPLDSDLCACGNYRESCVDCCVAA